MSIADNIRTIAERISWAAARVGRRLEDVKLVAITKTVNIETIKEAMDAGVRIFGENYVQEAGKKIEAIGHGVEWHMTGHLQRNKAREALSLFDMIETIDSMELAVELNKRANTAGRVMNGLIEVNLGGESSKIGIGKDELMPLLKSVSSLKNINIRGLMTIPPYFEDAGKVRPYFRSLRELRDMANNDGFSLSELSMGMSHDFETAVEEGATMVRIGRGIFGERS